MREVECPYGPGMVGLISGDDQARYHHLMVSLDDLQVPRGTVYAYATSCNPARNTNNLVKMLLKEPKLEWLWIMGDDHCFEEDCLMKLMAHGKDCIMPLTPRRQFPFDSVLLKEWVPSKGTAQWYTWEEIEQFTEPFPIAAGGSAGLLVRRRVFESMSTPYFQVGRYIMDDLQEDVFFTARCNSIGYTVYCDPFTTLGHLTTAIMFPRRNETGQIGIAANMSGFKMMLVPPGYTATRDDQSNDHIVKRPSWVDVPKDAENLVRLP